jgi:hypothetical protein
MLHEQHYLFGMDDRKYYDYFYTIDEKEINRKRCLLCKTIRKKKNIKNQPWDLKQHLNSQHPDYKEIFEKVFICECYDVVEANKKWRCKECEVLVDHSGIVHHAPNEHKVKFSFYNRDCMASPIMRENIKRTKSVVNPADVIVPMEFDDLSLHAPNEHKVKFSFYNRDCMASPIMRENIKRTKSVVNPADVIVPMEFDDLSLHEHFCWGYEISEDISNMLQKAFDEINQDYPEKVFSFLKHISTVYEGSNAYSWDLNFRCHLLKINTIKVETCKSFGDVKDLLCLPVTLYR